MTFMSIVLGVFCGILLFVVALYIVPLVIIGLLGLVVGAMDLIQDWWERWNYK